MSAERVIAFLKSVCKHSVKRQIRLPKMLAVSTLGIKKGDKVSVFADLEKKCRRGYTKKFTERKFFVGNGVCLYDRNEMFENNAKLKYDLTSFLLNPFVTNVSILYSVKHKIKTFLAFSGGVKWEHWPQMIERFYETFKHRQLKNIIAPSINIALQPYDWHFI